MQALETLVLRCPTEVGAWVGGEGKVSFGFDVISYNVMVVWEAVGREGKGGGEGGRVA